MSTGAQWDSSEQRTERSPRAPASGSASGASLEELAAHLAALPDADVVELLVARPDLTTPPSASFTALAARAGARPSVEAALAHLDTPTLAVAEAVVALGMQDTDALAEALGLDSQETAAHLEERGRLALVIDTGAVVGLGDVFGPLPAAVRRRLPGAGAAGRFASAPADSRRRPSSRSALWSRPSRAGTASEPRAPPRTVALIIGVIAVLQRFHRLFGGEYSGSGCYIVVTAGREDSRGLGNPMTEPFPRRPRVLGSPRSVALAKEGVPPEWEPGCGAPRRRRPVGRERQPGATGHVTSRARASDEARGSAPGDRPGAGRGLAQGEGRLPRGGSAPGSRPRAVTGQSGWKSDSRACAGAPP